MNSKRYHIQSILVLFCFGFLTPVQSADEAIARPFLIVPGFSLGKVQLGQSRDVVIQKMGRPAKSESRKCGTIIYDSQASRDDRKDIGNLNVDIWYRPASTQDAKRNLRNGSPNSFEVLYKNGKVTQITTTLTGYKTKGHLAINSTFQDFAKHFGGAGEANKLDFDMDYDRPAGSSHDMQCYWDFKKNGLAIHSDSHSEGEEPIAVFEIAIHPMNQSYLFNTPTE